MIEERGEEGQGEAEEETGEGGEEEGEEGRESTSSMTMRGTCRRACLTSEERIWVGVATENGAEVGLAREIAEVGVVGEIAGEVLVARESGLESAPKAAAAREAGEAEAGETTGEAEEAAGVAGAAARSKSICTTGTSQLHLRLNHEVEVDVG